MVKNIVVAILLSLVCDTFALDEHFSPVLFFKHKENKKVFEKSVISATTQVNQREFECRFESFDEDQRIVFFVVSDLSPEDLSAKNEQNIRAFQNIAHEADIIEYIPCVENAVNNKVTKGKNVAYVSVSTTNELEPEPSSDAKIIIVKLPGCHASESQFHCLARLDRAMYSVNQLEQFKDALFILSSEKNSRLQQQEHSRKRRAADFKPTYKYSDPNVLITAEDFVKDFQNKNQADTSIPIDGTTSTKTENSISVDIKSEYPLKLVFKYDPYIEYWALNATESTIKNQKLNVSIEIGAPQNFSFSCSSGVYFPVTDTEINGVYFKRLQIQLEFNESEGNINKFKDSYDCTGFTSAPIWAGLFITFLLLGIISTAISYIMDIRTMDRFDDPKGKTITVTASE